MKAPLSVAAMRVEPGERAMGVARAAIGTHGVDVPIIAICGREEGPHVTIFGGLHGAEYAGIEAARRLGTGIDPGEVAGNLVIVPIVNTTAFFARTIYTSGLDTQNLNRMFPGNPEGEPSERLAHWLFEMLIRNSDYYVDLHGGDMIEALDPFVLYVETSNREVTETARGMALASGIPIVIRSTVGGSAYGAAAEAGIPAIISEIGGQGVWNDDAVRQHEEATRRVLRYLNVLPEATIPDESHAIYTSLVMIRAETAGLFYPAVQIGDAVASGQHLGTVTDYFGEELQRVTAEHDGKLVFVVTSLATNEGDPLLGIIW